MTTGQFSALVVTGGHRVAMAHFAAMLDAICGERGWAWTHAEQPDAQQLLHPREAGRWNVVVLHDIAGLHLRRGHEPVVDGPDTATRDALRGLLHAGQGLVVLHHAIASWPGWDGWAHAVGGRFLYAPGTLDGSELPSSGYCHGRVQVHVAAPSHPVCAGVDDFEIDDEPYLCPVFESEVVPLLTSASYPPPAAFREAHPEVVHGLQVDCREHPPGSNLLGWAKSAGASPLVYLQPGDGPSTFQHPSYRRLLANAMAWVASPAAHAWARANPSPVQP